MQQRRGMHELNRSGQLDMAVAAVAGQRRAGDRQHRAQALAARADQVIGDCGDHRHIRASARQDGFVDAFHGGLRQPQQRIKPAGGLCLVNR